MSRFSRELPATDRPIKAEQLIAAGTSKHVLAGPRWRRVARGYYLPAVAAEPTPTQRIVEVAATMPPEAVMGGWAAAYALGTDLLDGRDDHTMRPWPVTVCLPRPMHRVPAPGVHYVRTAVAEQDLRDCEGIRCTGPARTALDLARWAPTLTEGVVAIDAMLQARVVPVPLLQSRLRDVAGCRGASQTRRAVALSRSGVRSTWESRLRMLYVVDLGHDTPLVNPPVFDQAERFLGAPDLLDVEAGLVMEFDGGRWTGGKRSAGHRDRDQHREDNVREELFERAGLTVVRADSGDLSRHRRRLCGRLEAARADGLARNRRRDRWTLRPPAHWLGLPA